MIGRLLYHYRRRQARRPYDALLINSAEVFEQYSQDAAGHLDDLIDSIDFRNSVRFGVRDGSSGSHVFHEVFINKLYGKHGFDRRLAQSEMVVDVGANIGLFTYYALLRGTRSRILAFEADPTTYETAKVNVQKMPTHLSNRVMLEPYAVASNPGTIPFYCADISGWSSRYQVLGAAEGKEVEVPAVRLSDYLHEQSVRRVDVLKIDVEGAEYDILLGDQALLEMDIQSLMVEVDRSPRAKGYTFDQMIDTLRSVFAEVVVGHEKYPIVYCWSRRT